MSQFDKDDVGDHAELVPSGLPEMTDTERVRAELEVLGLDVSRHVVDFYRPLLEALGTTWSTNLLRVRQRRRLLVAGVKVATQTPPVRSGRRIVFLTLDDTTGPIDATFFEDVQAPYARTLFGSWLLLVRGDLRRTGPRGVSLLADGCWDRAALFDSSRTDCELSGDQGQATALIRDRLAEVRGDPAPGEATRRVRVHPNGFRQSPYAGLKPAGTPADAARENCGSRARAARVGDALGGTPSSAASSDTRDHRPGTPGCKH